MLAYVLVIIRIFLKVFLIILKHFKRTFRKKKFSFFYLPLDPIKVPASVKPLFNLIFIFDCQTKNNILVP